MDKHPLTISNAFVNGLIPVQMGGGFALGGSGLSGLTNPLSNNVL
jgi:hypothetical protein